VEITTAANEWQFRGGYAERRLGVSLPERAGQFGAHVDVPSADSETALRAAACPTLATKPKNPKTSLQSGSFMLP
jgi:hypothetical protein